MSVEDAELKSFLTAFTDRPSSIPPGFRPEPYLAGSAFLNYYIFTKTFPDSTASRLGMVYTHALIVDINDIQYVDDLESFFLSFVDGVPLERPRLTHFEFTNPPIKLLGGGNIYPRYVQSTVARLVAGSTPIAFCGTLESFGFTLKSIWAGLPLPFRKCFRYTVGFSSNDLRDTAPMVIYFQSGLESKLTGVDLVTDQDHAEIEIHSQVELFLLGAKRDSQFSTFITDLNVDLSDFTTFNSSAKAYGFFTEIGQQADPNKLRSLIRFIAKLSPRKEDGASIKSKIIQLLSEDISEGKDGNIKALRNIGLEEFVDGSESLALAIGQYLQRSFGGELNFDDYVVSELIELLASGSNTDWWNKALSDSLKGIVSTTSKKTIHNIWKLLDIPGPKILEWIPIASVYEKSMIEYFPGSFKESSAKELLPALQKRKWFLLNAYVLTVYLKTSDALLQQLHIEEHLSYRDSVGSLFLMGKLSDRELLSLTLSSENEKLVNCFARRIEQAEILLSEMDISKNIWALIWAESLRLTKKLSHGVTNLQEVVRKIYHLTCQGVNVPEIIVELFAKSELADLSGYVDRDVFWQKVPAHYQGDFLEATANGFISRLIKEKEELAKPEKPLEQRLVSDAFIGSFLNKYRDDMDAVVTVYENLPGLKDRFLADYIRNYRSSISDFLSSRLGSLLYTNQFRQSAERIFEKAKDNASFKIALNKCKDLVYVGLIDKFLYRHLFSETITDEVAYAALRELALLLYPQGPEQNDLWERAGGKNSKLNNHQTREESWYHALHLLQYGGGGRDISVKSLLKEMHSDFQQNKGVSHLLDYFKK